MPRPGPVRPIVGVRLSQNGIDHIKALADAETDGNLSDMIRKLLAEATAARTAKGTKR